MKTMKLSDIKIKESFANSNPQSRKVEECRHYWNENHEQDRYLVVNHKNELIDGYIQYLVLKENKVSNVIIQYSEYKRKRYNRLKTRGYEIPKYRTNETAYIYGIHPNSKSTKERVWRVPASWKGWESDILPGDRILVNTKRGIKSIIVTKIEWSDKCPVDMPVRKVSRKIGK